MRDQDHGIVTLEASALFSLLPYIVRSRDNGAIRAVTGAWTNSRNRLAAAVVEMTKIYDPEKAARFSPSALGESEELYREYLRLVRSSVRSTTEEVRYQLLRELIPNSVAKHLQEREALAAIAGSVGESLSMISLGLNARGVLKTAIPRQHIKGSHSCLNAVGMITGLFDIKASELWSRYALKNPTDPASNENNADFAYTPDQYPLLSLTQYPRGSRDYDATVLDDYPHHYDAVYQHCSPDRLSPLHYNAQINGKNPFGYFPEPITSQLVIGTYQLAGGSSSTRAFVELSSVEGSKHIFESTTCGAHGDQIRITVTLDQFGSQTLRIRGPQSLIKFKTSMVDLDMAVDFERLALYFPPVVVRKNPSGSIFDEQLLRTAPDYPVTSSGSAPGLSSPDTSPDVSPAPEVITWDSDTVAWDSDTVTWDGGTDSSATNPPNYQVDMETYLEVLAVVRQLVESSRPVTRTVRKEFNGFSLRDQVLYAPVNVLNEVTLGGGNKLWGLRVDAGLATFSEVSTGTISKVYQRDIRTGHAYQWAVDHNGLWSPKLITNREFATKKHAVVLFGQTRVLIENSHLLAKPQESTFQDEIHADATSSETALRTEYRKLVENPAPVLIPYMSAGATSADEPDGVIFQSSPEDDLTALPTLVDFASSHIDPHGGSEEDSGAGGGNWYYTASGQLAGQDVRLRSAGIHGGLIEPVPTGGLTYGYPVSFLNYHNVVVWRNRNTNAPFSGSYRYASASETAGATLDIVSLGTDGPIEGSSVVSVGSTQAISNTGDGATPNSQVPTGFVLDMLVLSRMTCHYDAVANYYSVTEGTDGHARFNFRASQDFQIGNKVYLPESSAYPGVWSVTATSQLWFEIQEPFSATESGAIAKLIGEMLVMAAQTVTVAVMKDTNLGPSTVLVFQRVPGSSSYTPTEVFSLTDSDGSFEFSALEAHEILFFVRGRSGLRLRVLAPDNSLEGLPGILTATGSRVDVGLTLLDASDDRFWDYDQGSGTSSLDVGGIPAWRGGLWRGAATYETDNLLRVGMPGVLRRSLTISPSTVGPLPIGSAMSEVDFEVDSSEDTAWSIAFGELPTGLSLSADGTLSGTPTETGSFTFGLHASAGADGSVTIAITVVTTDEPVPDPGAPAFSAPSGTFSLSVYP